MTPTIRAAWSPGEVRIAVVGDAGLVDYALWRAGSPDGVGDVHRGRVISVVPAMAGAFIALNGCADGFLPDSEGAKGLTPKGLAPKELASKGMAQGAIITVRITRAALGGKGPRLSARSVEAADGPARLLRRGQDPLRELAARYPSAPIIVDDAGLAAALRPDLGDRVTRVADAFDDAIEAEVEGLAAAEVTLASGARLSVYPTPALVAIDVDAGAALAGGVKAGGVSARGVAVGGVSVGRVLTGGAAASGTSANGTLAAGASATGAAATGAAVSGTSATGAAVSGTSANGASAGARGHAALNAALLPELARQIRLRDLSGAILIDLAGMKPRRRAALGPALAAALAEDPLRPRFLGFTALGLAEIVRPRVRAPLHEMLAGPLASGLAALRSIAGSVRAEPGFRPVLRAAPAVIAALEADQVGLAELARVAGQRLTMRSDPGVAGNGWLVEAMHG